MEDIETVTEVCKQLDCKIPNVKISIYKNRRGSINKCYMWGYLDKGICRFESLFLTDYKYNLVKIED
jgi:hypothetical protein